MSVGTNVAAPPLATIVAALAAPASASISATTT